MTAPEILAALHAAVDAAGGVHAASRALGQQPMTLWRRLAGTRPMTLAHAEELADHLGLRLEVRDRRGRRVASAEREATQ